MSTRVSTPARRAASARNGANSHGPKTEEGKAKVRLNARKHGLTAKLPVSGELFTLPGESIPAFHQMLQAFIHRLQPADPTEQAMVEELARTQWLIHRAAAMFRQIIFDRIQLQQDQVDEDWDEPTMILRCSLAHQFEFSKQGSGRNISLYENSLRRRYNHILAALKSLRRDFPLPQQPSQENEPEKNLTREESTPAPTPIDADAAAAPLPPLPESPEFSVYAWEPGFLEPETAPPEVKYACAAA